MWQTAAFTVKHSTVLRCGQITQISNERGNWRWFRCRNHLWMSGQFHHMNERVFDESGGWKQLFFKRQALIYSRFRDVTTCRYATQQRNNFSVLETSTGARATVKKTFLCRLTAWKVGLKRKFIHVWYISWISQARQHFILLSLEKVSRTLEQIVPERGAKICLNLPQFKQKWLRRLCQYFFFSKILVS